MQVLGKHFDEAGVLRVAHAYQLATDWHRLRPERKT
jgi:aspartyl-tRNA(Asn)/glutamyl-tRNA(Gln) amidotransferase subunit A